MIKKNSLWLSSLLLLVAACNTAPPTPPPDPSAPTAITSFGATPNPTPSNVLTQFSWSLTGTNLTCKLDVDNNGVIEYTVPNCTSQSRVAHTYGLVGTFTAKLTVTGADGLTRVQTTPITVGAANIPPVIPILNAASGSSTDPLAVTFNWTTTDGNSDITRCEFDADSDGKLDYNGLCSGLPSSSQVTPSNTVSYRFTYKYPRPGRYSATLMAFDPYSSTKATIQVRAPYNRAPLINRLQVSGTPDNTGTVSFDVSDPDEDTLTCILEVQSIGKFTFPNCRNLTRNYTFAAAGTYKVTLSVSDSLETTRKNGTIVCGGGSTCNPYLNPPISTTVLGSPDVGAVAYTDDGNIMAVGNLYGVIRLFNVATGLQIGTNLADPSLSGSRTPIRAHSDRVTSLDFNNDGTQLASGSHDDKVKLWTITATGPTAGGALAYTLDNGDDVNAVAYSPDATFLASGGRFSDRIRLWTTSGTEVTVSRTGVPHNEAVVDLSFHYDSNNSKLFLASGAYDNSAKVWEVGAGQLTLVRTLGHSRDIKAVDYNHDGTVMAVGDGQGVIRLYNTATGAQIAGDLVDPALSGEYTGRAHSNWLRSVAFNHNGTVLASGSGDEDVKLWTIDCTPSCATGDGGTWAQTLTDPDAYVFSVAFNHDGTMLASGDADDEVNVWTVSGSTATHVTTLTEPSDWVKAVAFNHDGTLLASGDEDDDIHIWGINLTAGYVSPGAVRPATAPTITHLETIDCTFDVNNCHDDYIHTLAFSHDGSILAAGDDDDDDDGYVRLWSVTPQIGPRIMGTTPSTSPTEVPSGYTFAYISKISGQDGDDIRSLAFNDDSTLIAIGGDDETVELWNIATPASPSQVKVLYRPDEDIDAVAFSPDGTRLAGAGGDGSVFIWKIASGDVDGLDRQIGFRSDTFAVAFSSLGIVAVADGGSGEEGTIRLYDDDGVPGTDLTDDDITADSGFYAHGDDNQAGVESLDFSPDGTELASGGRDNIIKTWSITGTNGLLNKDFLYGHQDQVNDVEYSPDGSTLLSGSEDGSYRLWDPATSTLEKMYGMAGGDNYSGGITAMAFLANSTLLAMGDKNGVIQLYDTTTWLPVGLPLSDPGFDTTSLEGRAYEGVVRGLAFHPTTGQLISAGYDGAADKGRIKYWDITLTGGSYGDAFDAFDADLGALALSPNGSMLAVGDQYNGTIKLFNTSTKAQVGSDLTGHTGGIRSLEFSSNGARLVSSGGDSTAMIWNVSGSGATLSQTLAHSNVEGAVFTPDGSTVITAGGTGSNIRRWNASSGAEIGSGVSHPNYIRSLAMAPDGGAVAIVDNQGVTTLYDPSTFTVLGAPFDEHYGWGLNAVAFSPNGSLLATVGEDNSLAVWGYTICPAN